MKCIVYVRAGEPEPVEPGVFGSLEPEPLEKKTGAGAEAAWEKKQESEPLEKKSYVEDFKNNNFEQVNISKI